ncbi:hypothetical protein J3F82_004897 [Coemansia sp. RSA 637]|nr:hypothetical protein J3F82_004897 [Coemansia sp. RSA 637]
MGSSKKKLLKKARHERRQLECVFKLIFDYVIHADLANTHGLFADRLRELQPLTAVCHTWRQATLPLFYQSAVCSIKELPWMDNKPGSTPHKELIRDAKHRVPSYTQRSNIGLIIGGNNEHYVRKLSIELRGDVTPDASVSVLSEMGFDSTKWQGIEKLRISHSHGSILRNPTYSSESISRLNLFLLHALPNLTSVKYSSADDRRYYSEFPLDGLLASTLSRLKEVKLVSGLIPDMGSSAFLPGLVALTLRCPILSDGAHLPMVFAETLESLHMGFSAADTIWSRFYKPSKKRKLTFKRLKTLVLEYMEPADAKLKTSSEPKPISLYDDCYYASSESSSVYSGTTLIHADSELPMFDDDEETLLDPDSPTRLMFYKQQEISRDWPMFPKLKKLSVSKYPDAIAQILQHFTVERISHISIRDVSRGWYNVNATSVVGLSSLHMHISPHGIGSKRDEYRYQAWINRLFSVTSDMTSLQLNAPTSIPISLPDVIGLTRLTLLSFSFRIDLGTIPNLLSRLPFLQQLAIHVHPWSSWSNRSYGLFEHGDYEMLAHIPALSRSLQSLIAYVGLEPSASYEQSDGESRDEPMVVERELSWLLARVPSLKLFKTEEWTSHAIRECIDDLMSYESIAPHVKHLPGIEISVWKY